MVIRLTKRRMAWIHPRHRRLVRIAPRKKIKERIAKLRKKEEFPVRMRIEELTPKSFTENGILVWDLPEMGRLIGIDLYLTASATTSDATGASPSQPTHWWIKCFDHIEVKDGGTTIVKYHPYALRILDDLVFDMDIPETGTTSTSLGDTISVSDLLRIFFSWNVREDAILEQFFFDTSVGINLMDKNDPKLVIDTGSLNFTDTTLSSYYIYPVIYVQEAKSKIVPEAWADYKYKEISSVEAHELKLTEDKFHILDFVMALDSSGDLSSLSKVEVKDVVKNYTFVTLENALTEVVRVWTEQDRSKNYAVFPFYLGYFRNLFVKSDKEVVIKATNSEAGALILQQIGYIK